MYRQAHKYGQNVISVTTDFFRSEPPPLFACRFVIWIRLPIPQTPHEYARPPWHEYVVVAADTTDRLDTLDNARQIRVPHVARMREERHRPVGRFRRSAKSFLPSRYIDGRPFSGKQNLFICHNCLNVVGLDTVVDVMYPRCVKVDYTKRKKSKHISFVCNVVR